LVLADHYFIAVTNESPRAGLNEFKVSDFRVGDIHGGA
jgi:hypothetical protein